MLLFLTKGKIQQICTSIILRRHFINEKNVNGKDNLAAPPPNQTSLYGVVYEALMQKEQIGTVYGMINGIEGFLADTIMDMNSVEHGSLTVEY